MCVSLLNLLFLYYLVVCQSYQKVSIDPVTTTEKSAREHHQEILRETQKQQKSLIDELKQKHELCFTGEDRSPVDINLGRIVPIYVPRIEFINYNLTNVVKDLKSDYKEGLIGFNEWKNPPYIKGATLEGEYVLWEYQQNYYHSKITKNGMSNCGRVGHSINEAMHDFEGHLVHVKRGMTLDEAQGVPGAIVVVAVEFVISDFRNFSKQNIDVKEERKTEALRANSTAVTYKIQPIEFIPNDTTSFFTYIGSLAHAPCSRGVTWFVLAQPVQIPYEKTLSSFFMQYKINKIMQLAEPQSLGSRVVNFNYGEQRKPVVQDSGYPTYVLLLVVISMVVLTCTATYVYSRFIAETPNVAENDDANDRTMLVESQLLFSL